MLSPLQWMIPSLCVTADSTNYIFYSTNSLSFCIPICHCSPMVRQDRLTKNLIRNCVLLVLVVVLLLAFVILTEYKVFLHISRARHTQNASLGEPSSSVSSYANVQVFEGDHILLTNLEDMRNRCDILLDQDSMSLPYSTVLTEGHNSSYSIDVDFKRPYYMQLCLAKHMHQHRVDIKLGSLHDIHQCELYLSTENRRPSSHSWDWKIDSYQTTPIISLFTYLPEFKRSTAVSGALFIGLHRSEHAYETAKVHCDLQLTISKINNEALLARTRLRGGQVLLPRDVAYLFRDSRVN